MTRRLILTTATLAAFLAAGSPLAAAAPASRRAEQATEVGPLHTARPLITIGDRLIAVQALGLAQPGGSLDVALFLQPDIAPPDSILVWAGRKNAWGSQISAAEAVDSAAGLHLACVTIPLSLPDQARLWIGIDRDGRRPGKGSVPLSLA